MRFQQVELQNECNLLWGHWLEVLLQGMEYVQSPETASKAN